jgi:hypothetical protein
MRQVYPCARGDENPLFPHFLQNLVSEPRIEARAHQRRCDRLDPRRTGTVQLAERKRVKIVEVNDAPVGVDRRRDHG